jgi:hypothetical protein
MPPGISRSTFTRPFADVLNMSLGSIRNFYNRQGYNSPYDDVHRALRLHKQAGHDVNRLLKSVGMRAEQVTWEPPEGAAPAPNHALVLTPAPSQPPPPSNGATHLPVQYHGHKTPLISRLAAATPEGDTAENRQRLKEILNNNGLDLRSRDETKAQLILRQEGFTIENFVSYRDSTQAQNEELPDIDSMGLVELRAHAHAQQGENDALRLEIAGLNIRLGKAGGMLDVSKNRAFRAIRNGREDFTDAELAALNARAVIKQGFLEDV